VKIVIASDSWTGWRSSSEIAAEVAARLEAAGHEVLPVAMADGGVGTAEVLRRVGAQASPAMISDPTGAPVVASTLDFDGANFLESCQAVGLHLCPEPRRPLEMSSRGLGQWLMRVAATRDGPIVVGLGGSGTLDGGLGLALGLGLQAIDPHGNLLAPEVGAGALSRVDRLVGTPPLRDRLVQAWSDVRTPLAESAAVFGHQKGADEDMIRRVTAGLTRWAEAVSRWRSEHGMAQVDPAMPGGGAAGGLGFGLAALLDAHLVPGSAAVARAVGLDDALAGADAVITGEGRLDPSSFSGKVVGEVARRARALGVPRVVALAGGRLGALPEAPAGPDRAFVCDGFEGESREERLSQAVEALLDWLGSTL
jgi:glycerate kinase